jgi:hypothetical protein
MEEPCRWINRGDWVGEREKTFSLGKQRKLYRWENREVRVAG